MIKISRSNKSISQILRTINFAPCCDRYPIAIQHSISIHVMRFHFRPRREVSHQVHLHIAYYKKIIFIFHFPDSNHLLHPPIPIRFLLHLKCDGDGSPPLTRTDGLPTHTRLSHCLAHCHPSARRSLHQLHQMPDPLVTISNSP